jgi:uncharacterized membrane protein
MIEPIVVTVEEENPITVAVNSEDKIAVDLSNVEYVELLPDPIDLAEYQSIVHENKYYFIKG